MDSKDLEKLGLNKNEAKVYLALLKKGQACAADLVKALGVHRNIVYDNLEKLIEKGLVSFVIKGTKKLFIAEAPDSIIEFLNNKKENINNKIKTAKTLLPQISKLLKSTAHKQETVVFRGVKGIKKVLLEVLKSKENYCIGMSNSSVEVLGTTYWKNFNVKVDEKKIKEHFLLNADFKEEFSFKSKKHIFVRRLPKNLTQLTEFVLFDNHVAMFIFSEEPTVILIKDKNLFQTFIQHFDFLWRLSK